MANRLVTPSEVETDFRAIFTKQMRLNGATDADIADAIPVAWRWFERNVVGTPIRPPIDNCTEAFRE
jgi:hypothetical protein